MDVKEEENRNENRMRKKRTGKMNRMREEKKMM